jgi:bifunctional non-homologous end joining protein LigD
LTNRKHPRFVVHEHHARRLHYDLRLEMAGVLKSWALPKGPSMNPADKRLAVMVDDHSLDYIGFEGIIPKGEYGAGAVLVWDGGTYHLLEGDDPVRAVEGGRLVMELGGKILRGGFTLLRMTERDEKNWLLIKKRDACVRTDWVIAPALTPEKEGMLHQKRPPLKAHRCAMLGLPMR